MAGSLSVVLVGAVVLAPKSRSPIQLVLVSAHNFVSGALIVLPVTIALQLPLLRYMGRRRVDYGIQIVVSSLAGLTGFVCGLVSAVCVPPSSGS
ncbi:hypothetical protein EDD25_1010 [Cryobacterium psychrophilum]|nr:hypothetical protein EDD25_1010 [Cryobacterium psychrophilum]